MCSQTDSTSSLNFDFTGAVFSGGTASFGAAKFSGGTVDFRGAQDWSFPPEFP
jgi:hypothetical protein